MLFYIFIAFHVSFNFILYKYDQQQYADIAMIFNSKHLRYFHSIVVSCDKYVIYSILTFLVEYIFIYV
jgi:hypothetical protein